MSSNLTTIDKMAEVLAFRQDEVVDALRAAKVPINNLNRLNREQLAGWVVRASRDNPVFRKKLAELMVRQQQVQKYVNAGGGTEYLNSADPVTAVADGVTALSELAAGPQKAKAKKAEENTILLQGALQMKLNNQAYQLAAQQAALRPESAANPPNKGGWNKTTKTVVVVISLLAAAVITGIIIYHYRKKLNTKEMELGGILDNPAPPAPAPPIPQAPPAAPPVMEGAAIPE